MILDPLSISTDRRSRCCLADALRRRQDFPTNRRLRESWLTGHLLNVPERHQIVDLFGLRRADEDELCCHQSLDILNQRLHGEPCSVHLQHSFDEIAIVFSCDASVTLFAGQKILYNIPLVITQHQSISQNKLEIKYATAVGNYI